MITVPVGTSLRAAIADQLAAAADEKTRVWWERYLKGAVPFRGVPMAGIRRIMHETWRTTGVDQEDPDVQIELALGQFAEPYSEDKIAGVLALSELLLDTSPSTTSLRWPVRSSGATSRIGAPATGTA